MAIGRITWNDFSHYPLEDFVGFERKILKFSSLSTPPLSKTGKVVRFFENFFSHYLLEGNGLFGQKDLKLFLPSTSLTIQAVLNERFSYFLPSVPTGQKSPFGLRNRKLFSFTTQRTWDAEVVRFSGNFFLSIPNGHEEPFWTKENKKASGNYPKAVDFFTFSWYNKW